jgi:hypothetical protein
VILQSYVLMDRPLNLLELVSIDKRSMRYDCYRNVAQLNVLERTMIDPCILSIIEGPSLDSFDCYSSPYRCDKRDEKRLILVCAYCSLGTVIEGCEAFIYAHTIVCLEGDLKSG